MAYLPSGRPVPLTSAATDPMSGPPRPRFLRQSPPTRLAALLTKAMSHRRRHADHSRNRSNKRRRPQKRDGDANPQNSVSRRHPPRELIVLPTLDRGVYVAAWGRKFGRRKVSRGGIGQRCHRHVKLGARAVKQRERPLTSPALVRNMGSGQAGKLFARGNPTGAIRPAPARAPSHSERSGSLLLRPLSVTQDRPSASRSVQASERPPSL